MHGRTPPWIPDTANASVRTGRPSCSILEGGEGVSVVRFGQAGLLLGPVFTLRRVHLSARLTPPASATTTSLPQVRTDVKDGGDELKEVVDLTDEPVKGSGSPKDPEQPGEDDEPVRFLHGFRGQPPAVTNQVV